MALGISAVALALAVSAAFFLPRTTVTPDDVAWLAGETRPPADEATVYTRYLRRHRRYRLAGGTFGVTFAVVVAVRWTGSLHVGVGGGNPLADALLCGVAGIVGGALAAETYRLSLPRHAVSSASLAPRPTPPAPRRVALARVLGGATLAAALAVVALAHDGGQAAAGGSLAAAVVACGAILLAEATRAAVRDRRRPVLSDRAHVVDDRLRAFASTSVAWLELAAGVLGASWVLALATVPATVRPLQTVGVIAGLVASLVALHRAAPRPPRRVASTPTTAAA